MSSCLGLMLVQLVQFLYIHMVIWLLVSNVFRHRALSGYLFLLGLTLDTCLRFVKLRTQVDEDVVLMLGYLKRRDMGAFQLTCDVLQQ